MILLRCDANPQLGFGHLMRCRTLARAIKQELGEEPAIIGPSLQYATSDDHSLFAAWEEVPNWEGPEADARLLVAMAKRLEARLAVLDDYRTDLAYQQILNAASVPLLKFDGTAHHPLLADIVVNASPAARAADYREVLRNPEARLLLGPTYAILRRDFPPVRQETPKTTPDRIFLTFGGGDDRGAVRAVLGALLQAAAPTIRFVVVSGAHNPRNAANLAWIDSQFSRRVDYQVDPPSVAAVMASCDLAVMAGGTSTYEAASSGLPMLLLAIADNQVVQSVGWEAAGVARFLGTLEEFDPARVFAAFTAMISDSDRLTTQSKLARKLVPGTGAAAVARVIGEQVSRNPRPLTVNARTGC